MAVIVAIFRSAATDYRAGMYNHPVVVVHYIHNGALGQASGYLPPEAITKSQQDAAIFALIASLQAGLGPEEVVQ